MKKFYVYIHTCPNGKKYVGLTTAEPKKRWASGWGYKNNSHFTRAIQKYGWNNIEHQVFEVDTENEMYYLEKYLIAYYQTNKNEFGYNKSTGGEAHALGCHYVCTSEHKKKLSESHKGMHTSISTEFKKGNHPKTEFKKGQKAWNKGIPCSEEKRRKISESLKGFHHSEETKNKLKGRTAWNKGIPCSEEKRRKISESLKRRNVIKKELG